MPCRRGRWRPRRTAETNLPIRILGLGHKRSRGIKSGVVTDLELAELATREAIADAEAMAGVMLEEVIVSVSCGRLKSHNFTATADIPGSIVTEADLSRVLSGGQSYVERDGRTLVHLNEVAIRLDGTPAGLDPTGLAARTLSADLHAVSADDAPLRNLLLVVERCYLAASGLVPAPYASALSVTTEEERRLGVTVLEIGGGVSSIAMFAENRFIHADAVPLGGDQITFDIARALHTPLVEAERIKTLYGTLVNAQSDEHDVFPYPLTGDEEGAVARITKAELADIIRPRAELIVSTIRERLEKSELARYAGRSIVLTGGTSELIGLADYLGQAFGRPVRVASPLSISGLPKVASTPAFACPCGLLLAALEGERGATMARDREPAPMSYLERVGSWLREGF